MKVKELLTDETKWTKDTMSRDAAGVPTGIETDQASFCLIGAVNKCYPSTIAAMVVAAKLRKEIQIKHGNMSITQFNDASRTTFRDIKELIDYLDI
jgi:hypothetical protein